MANTSNNKLKLLPHQQEAYAASMRLIEEKGKAAIVMPTGCGKSFVLLKYILEHPDQRILFLAPRHIIKDQMYEYIVRFIGGDDRPIEEIKEEMGAKSEAQAWKLAAKKYVPHFTCMLYQTIAQYGESARVTALLNSFKPDAIIIDEKHHLKTLSLESAGRSQIVDEELEEDEEDIEPETIPKIDTEQDEPADGKIDEIQDDKKSKIAKKEVQNKWGEKFRKYLEHNPQAVLIGTSATPIRTDGTNVVERMFKGCLASEISLLEAIELGIIYPPRYVVPDFITEEEKETLLDMIDAAEGDRKIILQQKYDELTAKAAKAKGIPELMQEHIQETDGKYIIYCKDIADMQAKMAKAKEWFGLIDEEPEIYGIHSKDPTSAQQLEQFKASTSKHIKLMYCVGMIDEGMHLEGISGVILTAKTDSRTAYLQKIGRTIRTDQQKKQGLVIDLVNNNEILYREYAESGYEVNDLELLKELLRWIEKNDGNWPEFSRDKSLKEQAMARRLARINNKYLKYASNQELLENLDMDKQKQVSEIIKIGSSIGMFESRITLELSEEEKEIDDRIDTFLESIEIKGVRREFRDLLLKEDSNLLQSLIEIERWCQENFGDKPVWERRLPSSRSGNVQERKLENKWRYLKRLYKKYEGISIDKINDVDKKMIEKIYRIEDEYAFGLQQKHYYLGRILELKNWCQENYGDKPVWERRLPSTLGKTEKEQQFGTLLSLLNKDYKGKSLETIEKEKGIEVKKVVEIQRQIEDEYAFGVGQKNYHLGQILLIENWCMVNYGDKTLEQRKCPSKRASNEIERKLGWKLIAYHTAYKKYEGVPLEEIEDEVDRRVVEVLRRIDEQYNPNRVKQQQLASARAARDSAEEKHEQAVALETEVQEQVQTQTQSQNNEGDSGHEEQ